MAGQLISGPAGAGKSRAAREARESSARDAVVIDFQTLYAALLGIPRDPETGRYPERRAADSHALPMAEYVRRSAITGAVNQDVDAIVTNSDGNPERRRQLLGLIGPGAVERVVDPGRAAVVETLSVDGILSDQCEGAIGRWFNNL